MGVAWMRYLSDTSVFEILRSGDPMHCQSCGLTFPFLEGRCESCGARPASIRMATLLVSGVLIAFTGVALILVF
jgi:predicted amidophosphoribosyltransferase